MHSIRPNFVVGDESILPSWKQQSCDWREEWNTWWEENDCSIAEEKQRGWRVQMQASICTHEQNKVDIKIIAMLWTCILLIIILCKVKELEQRERFLQQRIQSMHIHIPTILPALPAPRPHQLLHAPTVPSQKHVRRPGHAHRHWVSVFRHPSSVAFASVPSFSQESIGPRTAHYVIDVPLAD